MKSIWDKTPAWLRAILLNIVLLFPASIGVQIIIQRSIPGATWGWGVLPVTCLLLAYWLTTKKLYPFKFEGDVNHSLHIDYKDKNTWFKLIGIFLLIICLGQIFIALGPSENHRSLNAIISFRALPEAIAIPLLFALALMASIVEEVTYRGFIQNTTNKYPKWLSFLIVALLFSIMHRLPWQLILPYVLMSIGFSLIADQQKSLGLVVVAHFFTDFIIFLGIYYQILDFTSISPTVMVLSILGTGLGTYLLIRDVNWIDLGIMRLRKSH